MSATFSTLSNDQLLDILITELIAIDAMDMIAGAALSSEDDREMFTVASALIGAVLEAYKERKAANS